MKKYSTVEVRCFKDSRYCHYVENFYRITEQQLEEELDKLAKAGWPRMELELDGKSKVLVNYQGKIHADSDSPGKSTGNNGENRSNRVKSRKNHDLKSNQNLVLNGLSKKE